MNNNLIGQLAMLARNGGDPAKMLKSMMWTNPMAAQALKMIDGKSPAQLQQMAVNMCKECNTTPEAVLQQLGLR